MVIAVRTDRGPDGLEVVKEAETDEDRVRLAHEAAILARAAHPGVVEVVGATDSALRLRHCGSPLSRLGPVAPDHAAAIVRAVAETVDALHRQGIAHRRIDSDHVVVNERGRPFLVGFGEARDGDAVDKASDVADLGAMLNRLLDDGSGALWSPLHRGVRSATRRKRAMAAFRTASAGAQRSEFAQRPTAHQFATAIGDALPGLSLPTPPGLDPDDTGRGGFAEIPHDIDPTADLGWTDFDLSYLALDDEVAPDPEDRPANDPAFPRDPYAVLGLLASPEPEPEPEPAPEPDSEPESLDDDAADPDDDGTDPIVAAMRAALASEPESESESGAAADSTAEEPAPEAPAAAAGGLPPPSRPIRNEQLRSPSIQIRPGVSDPVSATPSGPTRRTLIAVAAVVLIIGAVAGSVIARAVDPFGAQDASASPDTTPAPDSGTTDPTTTTDDAPATPPTVPEDCEPVDLPGPPDDDGCPMPITIDGRTATVGTVEVELGEGGDLVAIADSDCDGVATPVLLRPSTGEVFDFPDWNLDEAVEVSTTTVIDDAESIGTGAGSCPEVIVTDEAGVEHVVAP